MNKLQYFLLLLLFGMVLLFIKEFNEMAKYQVENRIKIISDLVIMQNEEYQNLRKRVDKMEKQLLLMNNGLILHDKEIMELNNKEKK